MKNLSQPEFLERCNKIHNSKYDYSLVEYSNISSKIKIICKTHGVFLQVSKNHKDGQGCPKCSGKSVLTKEEFLLNSNRGDIYDYSLVDDSIRSRKVIRIIHKETGIIYQQYSCHHLNNINPVKMETETVIKRFKKIHGDKYFYEYSKSIIGSTDKIKLIDNKSQDIFLYRVDRHLQGMSPNKVTLNRFKLKGMEIHNNKYDYSLITEMNGNKDKVKIICPNHGEFIQSVSNHINGGDGCPECAGNGRWSQNELISNFEEIHLGKYDYSKFIFENVSKKIKIICNIHGSFLQNINKHLKGQGCPMCSSSSKGEEYVKLYLDDNGIKYIHQHGFDTCKYINKLNFDFYLPDHNMCIEFDGIQHFKPVSKFGGQNGFLVGQKRDKSKNKWCLENNVKLIRIKYNQISEINDILNLELSYKNKIVL